MSATSTKITAEHEPSTVRYGQCRFWSVRLTLYGPDNQRFRLPQIDGLRIAGSERSVQASVRHVVYGNRQADRRQATIAYEHGIGIPTEGSALGAIAGDGCRQGPSLVRPWARPGATATASQRDRLSNGWGRWWGWIGPTPGTPADAQPSGAGQAVYRNAAPTIVIVLDRVARPGACSADGR